MSGTRKRSEADELSAHIARKAAEAPPLTPAQRDRLRGLLRPTPTSRREAA